MGWFSADDSDSNYSDGDRVRDTRSGTTGTVRNGEVRWDGSCVSDELAVAEANGLQRD